MRWKEDLGSLRMVVMDSSSVGVSGMAYFGLVLGLNRTVIITVQQSSF